MSMTEKPDVHAVPKVDLARYLGRWYEIRRLPLRQEDRDATDITATYSLTEDGAVRVDNRCIDGSGKPVRAVGEAVPADDTNARLKVTFLPEFLRWAPFTKGDYWILKLDPAYRIALVGTPDHQHLWLLARDRELPPADVEEYLGEARRQGFELSGLIAPRQTGRDVTDARVASAA
jgi:apolipoprotein D and lipocalin family protein